MVAVSGLAGIHPSGSNLGELREQTVKALIRAIVVLAIAGSWPSAVLLPSGHLQPLLLVSGLLLTAGLSHAALRRGPHFAVSAMTLCLVVSLTGVLYVFPDAALASYFCLIVLATATVGEWRFAVTAATLCTLGLFVASVHAPQTLWPNGAIHALTLIWAGLFLSLLTTRQLQTVAEWAWSNFLLAQEKVDEARNRQAELGQLSKSLNEACDRLERLNQELIQARAAAEEARRLKAEFAATVGHELRTPVNLIIGFSELLANADQAVGYLEPLPPNYRHDLEVIHRNAQHISQLVDDILDLSQVDAHRMALRKEPTALATVVQQAVDSVKGLYSREGLSLTSHLPMDLPLVRVDPLRVRQVLINLFYNAIRFTNHGGVTVSARREGAEVTVAVSDTGIGIAPEDLPRLFDEFRQAAPAAHGRHGSGLGLAVCKRFIELHGGSMWVTSKLGTGSTFYFTLPLQGNVVSTAARPRPLPVVSGNSKWRRIAVVDNTGEVARLLDRYLDDYEVVAVDPQTRPVELADGECIHAVLATSASSHRHYREGASGRNRRE